MVRHAIAVALCASACGGEASLPEYAPECNPLGSRTERDTGSGIRTMQCALPYPSSIYEIPDDATPTRVRLDIPSEALPIGTAGGPTPVDTSLWRRYSGFSASTRIVVEMAGGFDGSNLPFHTDIDASLHPTSPTTLIDLSTGLRVAHWAEADLRQPDPSLRVLFIHPADRLNGGTRYAVGLSRAVHRADGSPHDRPAYFQAVLDGDATDHARFERTRPGLAADLDAMEAAGVPRDEILLAWDFMTAADSDTVDDLTTVRDLAVQALGDTGLGYEITIQDDSPAEAAYRRTLEGTVTVPWFLTTTDLGGKGGFLHRDAAGVPVQNGESTAVFKLAFPTNPDCYAGGADLPVLLYGHGLFGDYHDIASDGVELVAEAACVIPVTTNWIGWDSDTRVGAIEALYDVSIAHLPMERLVQALVNFIAVGRTVTGLVSADPAASLDGVAVIRPEPGSVLYYGNSQGGIFGTTLMEIHPDVQRGVLGVPGGIYSFMLPRSVDWPLYEAMFGSSYRDLVDQRLLLTMFQSAFDISDPAAGIHDLVSEKQVLLIEALHDSQVPNLSTENMARSAGIPLLHGSAVRPWGFGDPVDAVPSALVIYEIEGAPPMPEGLDFVDAEDNGVHGDVRRHPTTVAQIAEYLTGDGLAHDGCDPIEGCILR